MRLGEEQIANLSAHTREVTIGIVSSRLLFPSGPSNAYFTVFETSSYFADLDDLAVVAAHEEHVGR